MHILIIGGSGFIGRHLTKALLDAGHRVTIKTRDTQQTQKIFHGSNDSLHIIRDYADLDSSLSAEEIRPITTAIHLAGAGIVDQRWTKKRRQLLLDSRIKPLLGLATWLNKNNQQLETLLIGSAIGYYGYPSDPELALHEESSITHANSDEFVHQLCDATETQGAQLNAKKVVNLRTGVVLGNDGGALPKMLTPAKLHLNGKIGDGQQWVSWIHIVDWINAALHIIEHSKTNQAAITSYNLTAPNPVRNAELAQAIGNVLGKKMQLPVPAFSLKLLLGEAAILLLGSQKVLPKQLEQQQFPFSYPEINTALTSLLKT